MRKLEMPPAERTLIPPANGWKEQTYYVVDVSWQPTNPIHRRIMYLGFINGRTDPLRGSYTCLLAAQGDEPEHCVPRFCHYLKVVSEITDMTSDDYEDPPV